MGNASEEVVCLVSGNANSWYPSTFVHFTAPQYFASHLGLGLASRPQNSGALVFRHSLDAAPKHNSHPADTWQVGHVLEHDADT